MTYKIEESYLIDESPEISIGESENWTGKLLNAFPAFKHKNYQLYFFGQLISLTGTWLQIVGQGWLVFELTKSAYMVGLITAIGMLPILFFALFAGVIIDRYPKKKLIIIVQVLAMCCALALGILTVLGTISVLQIAILAFLLGTTDALDKPARQAFVVEMVGKKDLSSAIALNAGIFNSARVIGPAIAGILIALYGTGWTFILNALSYVFVILAMSQITVQEVSHESNLSPIEAVKEGLSYSFSHSVIRTLLIFTAISAIFGWSYATLMPVVIADIFHQGASSLGYFYGATGLGALVSTVLVSTLSKKVDPLRFVIIGNTLFAISIIFFTITFYLPLALFFLFLAGLGLIMQFSTINSMIQHVVSDHIRGRVMSIYVLMFMGVLPIGSYLMGFLAEHFGPAFAIQSGSCIVLFSGIFIFLQKKVLRQEYAQHSMT